MSTSRTLLATGGFLLLVALATPGCATKKYVQQQVGTVDQRVSAIDKKNSEAISNLDGKEQKDVSRVEERAMSAESKANDAAKAAQAADQKAGQADQAAHAANDLAMRADAHAGEVHTEVENIDNFKVASTQSVLFGFNKAVLNEESKAKLDSIVQQTQGMSRFVVEVEGFTDHVGAKEYNLALSRHRADAVLRYLVDHGIPLRRLHMIGLGETPKTEVASSMTKKEMRRVVVNLYAPATPAPTTAAAQ
jgi:outer membrane protein OmpA-like peptidoglycan-associated protein